ncbi:MAG: DUF4041 domain-containing protein [Spirochaetaceae bacterium]
MSYFIIAVLILWIIILYSVIRTRTKTIKEKDEILKSRESTIKTKESIIDNLNIDIENKDKVINKYQPIIDIENEVMTLQSQTGLLEIDYKNNKEKYTSELNEIKEYFSEYEMKVNIEELGYFKPKYNFDSTFEYEDALEVVKQAEKELIRTKKVFTVQDLKNPIAKIAVSSLNNYCERVFSKLTYNNFQKSKENVKKEFIKINKLLTEQGFTIVEEYYFLKIQEMGLIYDLLEFEYDLKEEQAELKAQMREEEAARKEAEKIRLDAIKEQERYEKALAQAQIDLQENEGKDKDKFLKKIEELQSKLDEALTNRERATAMAQITKQGHVYIISNTGSFGDDVFKIGMTRRTEPKDRVKELSGASVPFPFDIHAMIEADNAPQLENELHRHFENNRMNRVNKRKEFFKVNLDQIEQICVDKGHKFKMTKVAEAKDYRQSLEIEKEQIRS